MLAYKNSDMGKFFAIVALLLLAAPCAAMFTENARVQVLDSALRPIEGASAYPIYQLNYRTGLVSGKPKLTNKDGYVNVTFFNNEFDSAVAQGNWTLVVSYGNKSVQKAVEYIPSRRWVVQVQLPVHYVYFLVTDQQGRAMPANVSIGNFIVATDGNGYARVHLADGAYAYSVEAMGVVKQGSIVVSNDTTEKVEVRRYTLMLSVVDDKGAPLQASVLVLGKEYQANEAGKLVVQGLGEESVDVDIEHGGRRKVVSANLESGREEEVVLDFGAPLIKDVSASVVDGAGRVGFRIEDEGARASGVDVNTSIRVAYVAGGTQQDAIVFPVGYGRFEAEIPIQPANTVVPYTIRVVDRDGNEAAKQGEYTVVAKKAEKLTEVPTSGGSWLGGVDAMQAVGGIAVAGLLIGLFVYVKKRMDAAKPPPEIVP